ncbi:transposase [Dolichospermum sp. ST_con]|nr:transposase [Dolichospermum sp. ST_con]MDD1421180.1 transposase [Dolichospermum sp. ST_sed1]MDD1426231.1 transposase [Dolichospermum sp. ST_sed9]MDD1432742.1 transposase [Dolichospermum sp. ST_sed6]MDD1442348.1 transposase [Dolichospermum sp. ST_sed3]MDD1447391.1 transposase [Dolichospermum sp. ST_sed8]MDD1456468.1 transposase [Dolichospermum sp. ST_sed7]MDD1461963.1 transposase [Dolichospermum sp. ST_sed2]MDD1466685.1 transposase [Dolichospermum sp. ST_sed5]MDD1473064.1 transposase [Do
MSNYRRVYIPGGTVFLTLVTYQRYPIFSKPENVSLFRHAVANIRSEMPFEILGAVVLPDHIHFIWTLPNDDQNYSKRVGKIKVLFTKSLGENLDLPENLSKSRRKHRESNIWQRRFWDHHIRNELDFQRHLDYIHFNPVKHGFVSCPHFWQYSSFDKWVSQDIYTHDWGCNCHGKEVKVPDFQDIAEMVGE